MINILIIDSQSIYGGGQKFYLDIIENLDKDRFSFTVSSPANSPMHTVTQEKNINFIPFTPRSRLDIATMKKFADEVLGKNFDIIVSTDSITWYTAAFIRNKSKSIKLVGIVHISTLGSGRKFNLLKKYIIKFVDNWWIEKHDQVIVSSKGHYDMYVSEGIREEKLSLIFNSVDYKIIRDKVSDNMVSKAAERYGIRRDKRIAGMIGRFGPGKDFKNLIKSIPLVLKDFKNVQFVMVGDGILKDSMVSLCNKLNIKNDVVFTGFVKEDYYHVLNLFDIFVNSTDAEGVSYAVLDAMALRKPIVATRIGGIEAAVRHEQNGILVPIKEPALLAEAIVKVLKNEELRKRLSEQNEVILNESFSLDVMIEKIEKLFNSLIHCNHSN